MYLVTEISLKNKYSVNGKKGGKIDVRSILFLSIIVHCCCPFL